MNILYGTQVSFEELKDKSFDIFILGGNHEERVYTLYESISETKIDKVVQFCFKDCFVPKYGSFKKIVIQNFQHIYNILEDEIVAIEKDSINILIDYSCMTKPWYYSIILYLKNRLFNKSKISVTFSYTPSKYSQPLDPRPNSEIAPLPGKFMLPIDKPKALIVCLGYEQNKAEGIIEHLDPEKCYIFYTKPALDSEFVLKIEENNKSILNGRLYEIFKFDFSDLLGLERMLSNLYQSLKSDYSIIIAPLGPKPFSLISMLMAAKFEDIDIWRVGSGKDINEYSRDPIDSKSFIINEIVLSKDECLLG